MQGDHPSDIVPRLCVDPLAARPVFVAPQRGGKPDDRELAAAGGDASGRPHAWCPFCAGNEGRTPPAVARMPTDASVAWRARIVPNRYPITCGTEIADAGPAGRPAASTRW